MRTETIVNEIYSFDELSDKAKERAISDYRDKGYEANWTKENFETLNKFAEIFPVKINRSEYGGRGEGVYYTFTESEDIENLSGQRLATYIWNNYKSELYKGKYYSLWSKTEKDYKHYKDGYPVLKSRYSKVFLENDCVLTGYCMDQSILGPIYDFLKKPDSSTFKELLDECFNQWVKDCNADLEDQNSDDYISDILEANDYEFFENGAEYE